MVDEGLDLLGIVAGCGECVHTGLPVAVFAVDNIICDLDMAGEDAVYEALYNNRIEAECEKVVDTGLAIAVGAGDAGVSCFKGSGHATGNCIKICICYFFDFVAHFLISFSFFSSDRPRYRGAMTKKYTFY